MQEPKNEAELLARLNHAKLLYKKRDDMVKLSREMYEMTQKRSTAFLGDQVGAWRNKVAGDYWEASNRPHNVVDVMASVLSGHDPQYHCFVPGNVTGAVSSRAEKFLTGVYRVNSRRQSSDIIRKIAFRTVLDGGVGVRVYWSPDNYGPDDIETVPNPEAENGEEWVVKSYNTANFPIGIDIVHLDKLYPLGRGRLGRPFDQLLHVESRTPNEVLYEWEGVEGADVEFIKEMTEEERITIKDEFVEWWGQKPDGEVWYALMYRKKFVKRPTAIPYPEIPYVISTFKEYSQDDVSMQRLPFLYPIFWAVEKDEYVSSRIFRMVDLYSNLPPVFRGNAPLNLEGTWGKIANLKPDERLEFPTWPGNPPDVYKLIEELRDKQQQGTFSDAMFGRVSSRMSGYGLSQLIGADTTRTDTPRANLELAYSAVAELIFALMRAFEPDTHIAVTAQIKNKRLAAMLSGSETKAIVVETFVQPKHMSDQTRLAALGAQLASLPNAPVSNAFILENYFGINQPEDEQERKMAEDVIKDPIVRMITLLKVLQDNSHPAAAIVQQQLEQAMQKATAPNPQQNPGEMAGLGLGLPQATMGNEPPMGETNDPLDENGPDRQTLMNGGPTQGMF